MLLIARGTIALDKLRADLETWLKWSPDESLVTHSKMEDQQLLSLLQKHARHPPGASKRRKACKSLMERLSQYWEQGRSEAVLAACIEAEAEDLNLHHPGHPNRATLCSNLAYSLNNHFQQTNDIGLLDEAIMLAQEALNLCPPGHLDRAVLCGNLAATLRTRFQQVGELVLIDRAVELEREALHLRAPGHPDRVLSCENLAVSLKLRFDQTGEDSLLGEMMMLQRESLDGRPPGHLRRTMSCRGLAASLTERYKRSGDVTLLEDIIALEREVLSVCPPGDPDRALSCANLAHSLWTYSQHMRNMAALDEAIGLEKQVLTLRPPGHPRRLQSIQGLANLLRTQYEQTGKMLALEQAIALERQVLEFRPRGHADRSLSCTSLALSLGILFGQSGELPLLDEAIQLEQEALDLCPPGHPDRASSCSNLAASLALRFQEAGEIALIDRAMTLEREALDLRPPGHAERAWSCGYLARLYTTRLAQTGEMTLLDEAILLQREAIDILPPSHPERAPLCGNLATSLWKRHNKTGEMTLLLQAIDLEREALALRPAGHSQRAWSCGNLSTSLQTLFEKTQIAAVLDESIELAREALSLRGPGHPQRAWSHIQLAHLLRSKISLCRMDGVAERDAFSEVSSLLDAALHLYSPQHPQRWRSLKGKAELAALLHDAAAITQHLREILDSPVYDDVEDVLRYTIGAVSQINIGTLSHSQKEELMGVYDAILELVALAAGSAVAMPTQLRHINRGSTLGAAAFMLSILLNELPKGLQLIERARGVIWAQMLHMRNPDLDGVPPEHGAKLRRLLQSTDTPAESIGKGEAHPSSVDFATHDRLYAQRGQLQETIRQIRSLPGLGNLMRGPDAQTLLTTAALNPVAILVADETACHVLVITSADNSLIDIPIPDVNQHTLADLTFVGLTSGQRGPTSYQYDRGMRVSKGMSSPHARLAKLWRTVVRPVIAHLGLSVSTPTTSKKCRLTQMRRQPQDELGRESIGAVLGPSRSCQYMQRVCTRAQTRSAVQTMSCHRIYRRSQHSWKRRRACVHLPQNRSILWASLLRPPIPRTCHVFDL
jgi:tetratricopeptide (TPR) repeat protein